jgi:D-alanyl-lipoteichoic acid acyltransferase DltB (MBOAT superfamily)
MLGRDDDAMLFPTVNFALFFVPVLAISWWLRPRERAWRLFIIAASWFFYAAWDARFVLLIAASTIGNYLAGRLIFAARGGPSRNRGERAAVALGVVLNLGLLGWFKYYGFFAMSLNDLLAGVGLDLPLPLLEITLPVGISFFTFQAISYVVDIGRREIEPMPFLDFATFLSFFPHLVAGPIVRASEFAPQLKNPIDRNAVPATAAFCLILVGLFKKVVISSYLSAEIVDPVFGIPGNHSSFEILVATYAYAVQIFADFSGYTDIAIGCALLLGIRFPQNFNSPYAAITLQDFWRRWHMSLSRWLRDYLYIPLGGNRGTTAFVYRNLFLTFLLGGLWHGAAWTFVIWGGIHGLGQVLEREWEDRQRRRFVIGAAPRWGARLLRWAVTFHVVCLAWIFFRADSLDSALDVLWRIPTAWGSAPLVSPLLLLVITGSVAYQFIPSQVGSRAQAGFARLGPALQAVFLALGLVLVDGLGPEGVSPFIYFRF